MGVIQVLVDDLDYTNIPLDEAGLLGADRHMAETIRDAHSGKTTSSVGHLGLPG